MARNYMYVYERIYKEQKAMQTEFRKIPIKEKRTSAADVKRIRNIISDSNYQVAQECQVHLSTMAHRRENGSAGRAGYHAA